MLPRKGKKHILTKYFSNFFYIILLFLVGIVILCWYACVCVSVTASFQSNLGSLNTVSDSSENAADSFGFDDFSGCDAGELVKLALQVNDVRQRAESYLSAVLVRLGDLEGDDAVVSVCEQFGLPAYRARRHVRTVKGLSALPDMVRAAKDGWITQDHADALPP